MTTKFQSTKLIELGSCAFRQWRASHSHCRFLHGYQLKAKLWFSGSSLDDKNWVVDFGSLKELKAELNKVFDHTTTVAADDPELATFEELDKKGLIQLRILDKGVGIERVAEMVYSIANSYIRTQTAGRCWVDKVEVFEHEENSASYQVNELVMPQKDISDHVERVTVADLNLANPTPQAINLQVPPANRAARVGNQVSQGMGNPFAGTSWGA